MPTLGKTACIEPAACGQRQAGGGGTKTPRGTSCCTRQPGACQLSSTTGGGAAAPSTHLIIPRVVDGAGVGAARHHRRIGHALRAARLASAGLRGGQGRAAQAVVEHHAKKVVAWAAHQCSCDGSRRCRGQAAGGRQPCCKSRRCQPHPTTHRCSNAAASWCSCTPGWLIWMHSRMADAASCADCRISASSAGDLRHLSRGCGVGVGLSWVGGAWRPR